MQAHCKDLTDESALYSNLCFDLHDEVCHAHRRTINPFSLTFARLCDGILDRATDADQNTDESGLRHLRMELQHSQQPMQ